MSRYILIVLVVLPFALVHAGGGGGDSGEVLASRRGLTKEVLVYNNGLLPPTSGKLFYGACHYPSDSDPARINLRRSRFTAADLQDLVEYCPDAVVNTVPTLCRNYWVRQALEKQFASASGTPNNHCPYSMFAAALVDHTDGSTTGANTHIVEGVNCGTLIEMSNGAVKQGVSASDSVESEVIRRVAERFPAQADDRRFWNKFTVYSTAEPTPAATAQLVAVGVREIVYGIRSGQLEELGYPRFALRTLDILRRQSPVQDPARQAQVATTALIGQVLNADMYPFFQWQHNETNACPKPCVRYKNASERGYQCRLTDGHIRGRT